jgi:hydrogenase expression/formation protein HypC
MCLAIPGEVLEVDGDRARAEFWDVQKWVSLDIVGDTVSEGDYVLNHAGFAIRKLPEDQVEQTLAIYESFLAGDEDDALEEIGAPEADLGIDGDSDAGADGPPPGAAAPGPMGTDPGAPDADGRERPAGEEADE